MKTKQLKGQAFKVLLLTAALATSTSALFGQDDPLLAETDSVLSSEKIDIDGTWNERPAKRELTAAEIIENARKKSELNNVQMIAKQLENQRISTKQVKQITKKEAQRLTTQIDSAFADEEADSVSVNQAATNVVAAPIESEQKDSFGDNKIKILPNLGVMNIQGENFSFESELSGGLSLESMVTKRISFGLGFNYTSLKMKDIDQNYYNNFSSYNSYYNNSYYGYNNTNYYMNPGYMSTFGQQRELEYKHLTFEVNSKVFLAVESRVRPYIGLGVAYNRASLEYLDKKSGLTYYNPLNQVQYGDEAYNSSYVSGSVAVGSEVSFTQNIGLNLELKYSRGLTEMKSESQSASYYNEDQLKLDRIGAAIRSAHFISIQGGFLVSF